MLTRSRRDGDRQDIGEGNHVKWDEVTIAEHDKERGTRQKIEEPPTPYHYESDDEGTIEHEVESCSEANKIDPPKSIPVEAVLDNWEMLRAKLQYEQAKQQQAEEESSSSGSMNAPFSPDVSLHIGASPMRNESSGRVSATHGQGSYREDINDMHPSFAPNDEHVFDTVTRGFDHEPKHADAKFKQKRNAHYNEFQLMKAMREQMAQEDTEESG